MSSAPHIEYLGPPTDIGYLGRFSIPLIRRVYPRLPSPNQNGYDVWDSMVAAIMSEHVFVNKQKREYEDVDWMKEGF